MPKKRSIIWTISEEKFRDLVQTAESISDILRQLNMSARGCNHTTFHSRAKHLNIDVTELKARAKKVALKGINKYIKDGTKKLEDVLVTNSSYSRGVLKNRLIKSGLLNNKCYICELPPIWCSKDLVLQLDHINGISNDNRLENLRLLCPNCHTQTETFVGKDRKKIINKGKKKCVECKKFTNKNSKTGLCLACLGLKKRKAVRPPLEELKNLIKDNGYCAVGRRYGVTDNTIRKWLKKGEKEKKVIDSKE